MAQSVQPGRMQLFPINIVQHGAEDANADSTSTDKEDVEKESEELLVKEEKESKWFDIFAGILVATVPMVLGGYILHLIETRSSSNEQPATAEPRPRKR